MKSAQRGQSTLAAEVTNVSAHGFWILLADEELFVPFSEFPWFQDATIRAITHIEWPSPTICTGQTSTSTLRLSRFAILTGSHSSRELTHNESLQPTSVSSLRSSPVASDLQRRAFALRNF